MKCASTSVNWADPGCWPRVIGVDPGPEKSAAVILGIGVPALVIEDCNIVVKERVFRGSLMRPPGTILAVEIIQSFGMAVGRETFETCEWIGRFIEAAGQQQVVRVPRMAEKSYLCQSPRAKDANIRRALIDLFGGNEKALRGTKKNPGPLYGVAGHAWSALAVAVTGYAIATGELQCET